MAHNTKEKKERKKKYPWVNGEEAFEKGGMWKLPAWYFTDKLGQYLQKKLPEENRDNPWKTVAGGFIDGLQQRAEQTWHVTLTKSFPYVSLLWGWANGTSNIEHMYTVEHKGHEIPIYLSTQAFGVDTPTPELLQENVRHVVTHRESPYNDDSLQSMYNGIFGDSDAVNATTRGDYSRLQDPKLFRKWFVRDHTYLIQQRGELIKEETEVVDGVSYTIRTYEDPSKWMNLLYNFTISFVYDFIDAPFDPLQRQIEKVLTHGASDRLIENEYKRAISPTIRAFFRNDARNPLEYDMKEPGGPGSGSYELELDRLSWDERTYLFDRLERIAPLFDDGIMPEQKYRALHSRFRNQ
ncbi:MAG: hypothetical protein KKA90_03555 [Nanoarchaeota archaeon]|nr:hypothetical protein [Nanoarchaeota archaeon]